MAGGTDSLDQSLGFDASEAIKALENLDHAMASFGTKLALLGEAMVAFNAGGGATVQVLKDIATHSTSAAEAMAKLMTTFGQKPTMGMPPLPPAMPTGPGVPGGAIAVPPTPPLPPVLPPVVPPVNPAPIRDMNNHVRELTLSWQTLGRVVETQMIVRALSMIRDAAKEAFTSNIEFVKSLTELRSISPEKDLGQITSRVKELSREFNIPLAQVVEAQYQIISHQFADTAQQADILTAALKIAKVAEVDAGKAADVLASAIQAYGKGASEAELVTAKIQKAAAQGHMRFTDFSQILGRVAPLARELGVSFDDLLASIDSLAIAGVRQGEIATTLRASMQSLLKPNRDLKEEMQGVSGEGQIAAYGLMQSWAKIRGDTNGTVAEMAKFISSARGMGGTLRATGQGADAFADSLKGVKAVTAGGLNVDFKMAESTDVAKLTKEINKLHIALTTDLGASMVSALNKMSDFVGGADTVVSVFRGLIPLLATAGTSLVTIGGTLLIIKANAALAAKGLTEMSKFATGAGLVAAAVGLGLMIADAFENAQKRMLEGLKEQGEEHLRQVKANLEAEYQARLEANDKTVQAGNALVNRLAAVYQQDVKASLQATQDWRDQTKIAMDSLVSARERGVRALRDLATEANRDTTESLKRAGELEAKLSDVRFQWAIAHGGTRAYAWQNQEHDTAWDRSRQLAEQATEAMKKARSPEDVAAVQNLFKRAEAFQKEGVAQEALRLGVDARLLAEQAYEDLLQREIEAEKVLQGIKKQQADKASADAAVEEGKARRMRELVKETLKEATFANQQGEPLTEQQRAQHLANARRYMDEFRELAFSGGGWQVSDLLSFVSFKQKMETAFKESVTTVEIKRIEVAPEALAALNHQISQGIGSLNLRPEFVNLATDPTRLVGKTFLEQAQETRRQMAATKDETAGLVAKTKEVAVAEGTIADKAKEVEAIFRQNESTTGRLRALIYASNPVALVRAFGAGESLDAEIDRVKHFQQLVAAQAKNPNFGMEQYRGLARRAVENFEQRSTLVTEADNKALAEALLRLHDIAAARDKIREAGKKPTLETELMDAQRRMDAVKKTTEDAAKEQAQMTGAAVNTDHALNNAGNRMRDFVSEIHLAIDAMQELATVAAGVPVPEEEGMIASKGGMAFLAGGGRPRGTDTIPAMLSPGEMVMSAATTRRFASQLSAMNAGMRPSFHSQGGHVTNIGDIAFNGGINVQGGNTGAKTARAIATELRRELRRGTSVL